MKTPTQFFISDETKFFSPLIRKEKLYIIICTCKCICYRLFFGGSSTYTFVLKTYCMGSDISLRPAKQQWRQLAVRYDSIVVVDSLMKGIISLKLIHSCIQLKISNFLMTLYKLTISVNIPSFHSTS